MRLVPTTLCLGAIPMFLAVLGAACADEPAAEIGLVMAAPQGLLDDASSVTLKVFAAEGRTCTNAGAPNTPPEDTQEFQLSKEGCAAGSTWCGEITLPRDNSEQMFHVEARSASGLLGQGCATARIDQDPVQVNIRIVRYVPPPCCNDGILQTGELCDTGEQAAASCEGGPAAACGGIVANAVCNCDCSTVEIPVDRNPSDPLASPVGQGSLSLVFAPGAGELQNGLRAVYQTSSSDSNADIAVRALTADLFPIGTPAALANPLRLQISCGGNSTPLARGQRSPRAAVSGTNVLVSFSSNTAQVGRFDVILSSLNENGCNDSLQPLIVSDGLTTTSDPDIATGPAGAALIVWAQGGGVRGRILTGATLGDEFVVAAQGAAPRVAGSSAGWVVVHQGPASGDDDGIVATRVSAAGAPSTPLLVNLATAGVQDQPAVAMQPDGAFAVAWRSAGDVFLQRFGSGDDAVAGDQEAPAHLSASGAQSAPALGVGSAPAPFYLAAWQSDSSVRARFFGAASGVLYNPVDGQNGDFEASPAGPGARARPAVAVGGNGHVVIGWEDASVEHTGVWVRRFPLPTP
jgi:hypothetical protein